MSVLKPKNLYTGNASPAGNIYTASNSTGDYAIIKLINICNSNTTTARTFSLHLLTPSANTANANNIIVSNLTIPPSNVVQIDTAIVLDAGGSLFANHTGSGDIAIHVSGVEYR